jgi:colanic acid biosynthesis glycosyl transferase WcaI
MFKGLPFAKGLAEIGHRVEVVTGFPNYPAGKIYPGYRIRASQRENIDSIPVLRLPLFPSHSNSTLGRIANYISFGASAALLAPLQIERPDVIYVYNLITLGLAARLARRFHGCSVLLDVQDLWPESVLSSGMMKNRWMRRILQRWCAAEYARPDHITVLSPGFKQRLLEQGVPARKVDVVYNWCEEIPINLAASEKRQLRRELCFEGRFVVLFAGTMGRVQALDVAIAAAAAVRDRCPTILFAFLGGGVDVARLKSLAQGQPNVRFMPKCSVPEAMRVISAADALLVHLKDDPLFGITIPSKTQAYLYAGKPILMGVRGDAADLVKQAGSGIAFEPENLESLVGAVEEMFGKTDLERSQMGVRGRAFYLKRLSFAEGLQRFNGLFQRLIESRRYLDENLV